MENQKPTNLPSEQTTGQPRPWVTPTFECTPLKEAMSGYTGSGSDNTIYS